MFIVTTPPTHFLPHAAAIAITNSEQHEQIICSGIAIDDNLLLTAGHCAAQFASLAGKAFVTLESDKRRVESVPILSWELHPNYQETARSHLPDLDVALIRHAAPPSRTVRPSIQIASSTPNAPAELWMQGFSPSRLKLESIESSLVSARSWIPLKFQTALTGSGKFRAQAPQQTSAACPGDSGSPVWNLSHGRAALVGIVVQGDCERGKVNVVELSGLRDWLKEATLSLNGLVRDRPEWMKTFPLRLFAGVHRP
ncbi:MAG: hypothetical protein RIR26_210 [Pseudomonadota bacterium]|jgi:secreted trypsin-like serine protease